MLAQREGDVVVEAHRAEERAVLEQDAEQLAHLVEVCLAQLGEIAAVDHDRTAVGLEQADKGFQEDRLAGARGAEHHGDLAGRKGQRDVLPDDLASE